MFEKTTSKTEKDIEARREFLKKARNVAVAVPAATLLVAAATKRAAAVNHTYDLGAIIPP